MASSTSSTPSAAPTAGIIIPPQELKAFCMRGLQKAGAAADHASVLADLLVAADYRGHFSHGLNRLGLQKADHANVLADLLVAADYRGHFSHGLNGLGLHKAGAAAYQPSVLADLLVVADYRGHFSHEFYMADLLESNVASLGQEPEIVKQTAATALVDGHNLLGPVVGRFSMDLAIQKAKEVGIGWVSARGSNHFGIAGWYSMRAQEQGLLGMAFTNTSPNLVPTRSRQQTLGTNPITLAAPANNGDSMVLDMATTVVAFGKVEVKKTLNEEIPLGWGVDSTGKTTTDTDKVLAVDGGLMPLGGPEETSGYKGYGLAMMVEVFCGILSGSAYGPHIRHWTQHHGNADLGQCFVAIDPEAFAPGFTDRMSDLLDHCRGLEPAEGETEVLVPGDPERQHMALCDGLGGIPYKTKQIEWADNLAKKYQVNPLVRLQ